jgi:SGNH hydrolase-like domain, acetyltransferase AlgX
MVNQGFDADRSVTPLDREEIAKIEVGQTTVSPRVARALVAWFLLMLASLPLFELLGQGDRSDGTPWSHLADVGDAIERRVEGSTVWRRIVTANRGLLAQLTTFETALEDQSTVGRALRPPTQFALTGWLGAGNERVYIGRERWLFFRPDVEYVTGRGFLDPRQMDRRVASASEYESAPQPDPRPAIVQFKHDLDARDITLVVMPTPVKPTIHPSQLSADVPVGRALHNASFDRFVADLRAEGVLVFDATTLGPLQYHAADTHWTPQTMQRVAEALAAFLQQHVPLPPVTAGYQVAPREAQQIGDTAGMLDLPPNQTLYPPERVTLRFVTDAAGDPLRAPRDADILVLGDSFTNIYSLPTMGWGEAAGLVEQLSYTLQRPIDRIVQNDEGAYATRGLLRSELDGGSDRLAGKRVVVWQFAARELAFGDWRVIRLPD